MRLLGVDWGERRLGIAVSDETQTVASPHVVERCRSDNERVEAILRHASDLSVDAVVLGMPLSLSGDEGPTGRAVRRFSELLGKRLAVPLVLWDERLTTGSAQRALIEAGIKRSKRKDLVDKVAASIMLQSYLDCQKPPTVGQE
ncbi:MAG: Holliday junction resolvase RuvX [Deltaproteobacteria bacterium]|nr:Holliday junction resolvase RuvX [Deltaproteobacteria bacterium]